MKMIKQKRFISAALMAFRGKQLFGEHRTRL